MSLGALGLPNIQQLGKGEKFSRASGREVAKVEGGKAEGVVSGVKRRSRVKKKGGLDAAERSVTVKTESSLALTTWSFLPTRTRAI